MQSLGRLMLGAALIAGLAMGLAAHTAAQEPENAVAKAVAPAAIPISAVAERADELTRQLRAVRERIVPAAAVEAIAEAYVERQRTISVERGATLDELATHPPLSRLDAIERNWERLGFELLGWRRALTQRARAIESDVAGLAAARSVWQATLESASQANAPAEVTAVIRVALAEIDETVRASALRREEVLALQNRVAQQELVVSDTLDVVRVERSGFRGRLLDPEEPPIWSAWNAAHDDMGEEIGVAFQGGLDSTRDFLAERRQRLWLLGLVFGLALLAAHGLKRSVESRRGTDGVVAQNLEVFRRPVTIALLIALLATYSLFPLAPEAAVDAVGLLLLVPMLRLLPGLMHAGFRPILYGIAAFYLVDRLRDLFEGAVLGGRIAFVVECAAALVFCVALLRPARLAKVPDPDNFPRWPAHFVRATGAIFALALVANLLGYVALSILLGDGVLTSIYLGVVVYASARVTSIIVDVTTKTDWARNLRSLSPRRAQVVSWIDRAIMLGAGVLWLYGSLAAFAVQDPVVEGLTALLTASVELGDASLSLGAVVVFGVTVAAAVFAARLVRVVVLEDVFAWVPAARGIPNAASSTLYYLVLFGGVMLALTAAGVDFSRFALLAGALGVGLGFGLQNIVNNFVSGIILLYERPIQVGDTIDMGDLLGYVKRIGIRSSTVRTFAGAEVIVPNADLISNRVINWTLSDRNRRVDVPIGVKYGTDPERVRALLLEVAAENSRVLDQPPPSALFRAHGDSSLNFELRAWIANFEEWFAVESELNIAINRALADAGIEIPFPQRDLHLRSVDAKAARRLGSAEDEA